MMKTLILVFLLAAEFTSQLSAEDFTALVVGVVDGDTIEVRQGGRLARVRLSGVDAPELEQPFGKEAKTFTTGLCMGEFGFGVHVTVQDLGRDRLGRTVADVVLPDGRILNKELLKAGLAWWHRMYSADDELARLEGEAKKAKRGLWKDASPTPPWEWRQASKRTAAPPAPKAPPEDQEAVPEEPPVQEKDLTFASGECARFHAIVKAVESNGRVRVAQSGPLTVGQVGFVAKKVLDFWFLICKVDNQDVSSPEELEKPVAAVRAFLTTQGTDKILSVKVIVIPVMSSRGIEEYYEGDPPVRRSRSIAPQLIGAMVVMGGGEPDICVRIPPCKEYKRGCWLTGRGLGGICTGFSSQQSP